MLALIPTTAFRSDMGTKGMEKEMKARLALMDDLVTFSATEASSRIMDIAMNADLGPRECVSVLIKASGTLLLSALAAAMDDDMPKEMALGVLRKLEDRITNYRPVLDETETAH
jgi:hypothetical protein